MELLAANGVQFSYEEEMWIFVVTRSELSLIRQKAAAQRNSISVGKVLQNLE